MQAAFPSSFSNCKLTSTIRLFLLVLTHQSLPLGSLPLDLALTGSLGLGTLGIHLLLEDSLTLLLGLGTVDLEAGDMSVTEDYAVWDQLGKQ